MTVTEPGCTVTFKFLRVRGTDSALGLEAEAEPAVEDRDRDRFRPGVLPAASPSRDGPGPRTVAPAPGSSHCRSHGELFNDIIVTRLKLKARSAATACTVIMTHDHDDHHHDACRI